MNDKSKLFSVDDEVALHPELNREHSAAEDLPEPPRNEADSTSRARYYSSTAFEPGEIGRASCRDRVLW